MCFQCPRPCRAVENEAHCDFVKLREMLIRVNMEDLREQTHSRHYELYRRCKLEEMGFQDTDPDSKPFRYLSGQPSPPRGCGRLAREKSHGRRDAGAETLGQQGCHLPGPLYRPRGCGRAGLASARPRRPRGPGAGGRGAAGRGRGAQAPCCARTYAHAH